ncbi:beta-galactosidase [Listeria innocua]
MFHGGTNFGFYNGCSARGNTDLPQITSYDYDALLNEAGQPTEKYYAVQRVIKEVCPSVWQAEPRTKTLKNLGTYPVNKSVSLFHIKEQICEEIKTDYPLTMEQASNGYGYLLYSLTLKNYGHKNKLRLIETNDRAQIYIDGKYNQTQTQETLGDEMMLEGQKNQPTIALDVLGRNSRR